MDLIYQAATVHREHQSPNDVQVCTLLSIKTSGCPEDCSYCPQSVHHNSEVEFEKLLQVEPVQPMPEMTFTVTKSSEELFLEKRSRATIELSDGTFTIPIVTVVKTKYAVTLVIPLSDSGMSFVPKPGSELHVSAGDVSEKVYFPGTYSELPELNIGIMHLIRSEEPPDGEEEHN